MGGWITVVTEDKYSFARSMVDAMYEDTREKYRARWAKDIVNMKRRIELLEEMIRYSKELDK